MKRLLVHVGYPKAASTSLQNGLFLTLHRNGRINFLGRAWESSFYGALSSKREYKLWLKDVLEATENVSCHRSIGELSDNVLNVLSEGIFMNNERRGIAISSPFKIQKHFSRQADRIQILIIIRNQQDLIPSYYVTTYRRHNKPFIEFIKLHIRNDSFPKLLSEEGKVFDFYSTATAYAEIFGKDNIHIVLFEDMVKNKPQFEVDLGFAMGLDECFIRESIDGVHLNKTIRDGSNLVVRKLRKRSARRWIYDQLKTHKPTLANIALVKLPTITDEEKKIIFSTFRESNQQLAIDFGLDSMKAHGYF